jgi:hypothetical protein
MKVKELKLYNKYKNINNPNKELIYIGISNNYYFFLYKTVYNTSFSFLKRYGFDPDKIVNDLSLETFIHKNGNKYIKGYDYAFYLKEHIEIYFKQHLKDKLKNIINR